MDYETHTTETDVLAKLELLEKHIQRIPKKIKDGGRESILTLPVDDQQDEFKGIMKRIDKLEVAIVKRKNILA